ncbi:MAG: hypothetical protein SVR04_06285 [Spirochaetota bacterium]|nr:hypothetical protein [Spirochaetota bacterium]
MRTRVFAVFAMAVILTPLYGQTTGEVLNQKIESQGSAAGASAEGISEAQQLLRNSLPAGAMDEGWKVVAPFDSIHVKPMQMNRPGHSVTLVISPELASYVDTSGPRGLGGSIRTYGYFLGRGLAGTMAAYLERYVGPVSIVNANDIPGKGLAVVPSLSGFSYKFPGGILTSNIQVNLDMDVRVYWNGMQVHSSVYSLKKEKGPKPFPLINSEPVAENMVYIMSELVSRSVADINSAAIASAGGSPVILDMDKVILASLSWEDYQKMKDQLSDDEKGLAHYFMAIDMAYKNHDTERQALLLGKLQGYVKTHSIEASSREELMEEMKARYAMRDVQQRVRNETDDAIFNFAGEHTEAVLDTAEIAPDVAKVALIMSNPVSAGALFATMATFETVEGVAKFTGAASSEYFFGSGEASEALFAGSKAFLIDKAGGAVGKKIGTAVAGKLVSKQVPKTGAAVLAKNHSDDFSRHVASEVYKKNSKIVSGQIESVAQFFTKPGAQFSADAVEKAYETSQAVTGNSVTASENPPALLPDNAKTIAGGEK